MKKAMTLTLLAATSLLATTAMAQDKTTSAAAPTVAAIADALDVGEKMTATAMVLEVDQKHRTLTLKGEDGKPFTIQVGDEVRNLAQVKAGDTVFMKAGARVSYQNGPAKMVAIQVFAGPAPADKYQQWKPAN